MTIAAAPPVLDPSLYIPDLKSKRKDSALAEMIVLAHQAGAVRDLNLLLELLKVRERLGGFALGKGVALPHARSVTVLRSQLVLARSHRGLEWGAADEQPVSLVLLALSPAEWSEEAHHAFVARAAAVARLQRNRHKILAASSFVEIAAVMREVTG